MRSGTPCGPCGSAAKKTLGYRERDPARRKVFLRLRERYRRRGQVLVYVDGSGFAREAIRRYGRARVGEKVHGWCAGQRRPRTSLLAARLEGQGFDFPFLFEGTCTSAVFNQWLQQRLVPALSAHHVVILDNAAFHKSATTRRLIGQTGARLLFLPPYSPDLNPIEHDFANLKKRREYHPDQPLNHIVKMYCYLCE